MLQITLLADEWKSSKGGLSTLNRELAIELAKRPNVAVTFFVPNCDEADKNAACSHKIQVVKAQKRPGFPPVDWLCFPPKDLVIDVIVGHGVPLGRQAQIIKENHHCTWMQVVHTTPEELAMHKTYPDAISKGDEKQWTELELCKMADFVVTVGPKLFEFYSIHLHHCGKDVLNLTPGIFTELSDLAPSIQEAKKFRVLLFGRGDSEDFELKGFDIAARAVAELNDRSYQLIFVGAPRGKEARVRDKLLEQGLSQSQLTVKGFIENREDLATLLSTANIVAIPSRTEGFGLTALEALSAGLPFLVSQNSGFGEALEEIPSGLPWIIDSEDPKKWAVAIEGVREKGREIVLKECQELRTLYAEKYSWEKQCNDLMGKMLSLVSDKLQTSNSDQGARPKEAPRSSLCRFMPDKPQISNSDQGARPKQASPSSTGRTTLKAEAHTPMQGTVSESERNRVDEKSVQPPRRRNSLQEDQSTTEQRTEDSLFSDSNNAKQRRRLHLFNCDHTYKLDAVEDLLAAMTAKLGFCSVEKHYFSFAQMSEMTTNTIPKLQMDVAFFVVHAHESRLSIIEDNAGGYAEIYRALLEATAENVLLVIGGDDHYKGEDEEEEHFLSDWARKTVIPRQFRAEFLDGRKSFIFSWNKKHRPVHEEALLHYLDPSKKGQKFVYKHKSKSEAPNIDLSAAVDIQQEEAESSPQEPEGEEEAIDGHVDEHDPSESDIQVSSEVKQPSSTTSIKLMTYLRYGNISYASNDVLTWDSSWRPPASVEEDLKKKWKSYRLKKLTIFANETGEIKTLVESPTIEHYCSIS